MGSRLETLLSIQKEHVDKHGVDDNILEALRHFFEHLGKMSGKVAGVLEPVRHGASLDTQIVEDEVIGDLIFWALTLSYQLEVDPEEAFWKRINQARARFRAEEAAKQAAIETKEANADR